MKKLFLIFIFLAPWTIGALERIPISSVEVAAYDAQYQVAFVDRLSVATQRRSDDGQYWFGLSPRPYLFDGDTNDVLPFVKGKVHEWMHFIVEAPGTYRSFAYLLGSDGFTTYKFDRGTFEVTQEDIDAGLPEEKFGLDTFSVTDQGWMFLTIPDVARVRIYQDFSGIDLDVVKMLADSDEYNERANRSAPLAIRGSTLRFRKNFRDNVVNNPAIKGSVVVDFLDGTTEEFDLLTGERIDGASEQPTPPEVTISMVAQNPAPLSTGAHRVPKITVQGEPGSRVIVEFRDSVDTPWIPLADVAQIGESGTIDIVDREGVPFRLYRAVQYGN